MRYAILHSGHPCTELLLDLARVRDWMKQGNHVEFTDPSLVDVVFVSTCAFNQEYEEDGVRQITEARKLADPEARIVVIGCLPPINPDRFAELAGVEALPPQEMHRLAEWFPADADFSSSTGRQVALDGYLRNDHFMAGIRLKGFFQRFGKWLPLAMPRWLDTVPMPDWFFVRAGTGCAGNCSYCAIRRSRGHIVSAPLEKIVQQVEEGVRTGHHDIALAGDDMGCWGSDRGSHLGELLDALVSLPGDFKLHIRFVEPYWLIRHMERLIPAFNSGRIHGFCMPLQSGSQRILHAMNRNYKISDAIAAAEYVMHETRVSSISSIVMVGFPGETAEDFARSYALLERSSIPLYQVLKYEGRPGTPSESLPDPVPEELKIERQERFRLKMKLLKFAHFPAALAERRVQRKFGLIR